MGTYRDLRDFLTVLKKNGQLLHITERVLPEPDLAAAACALTKLGESSPAIEFTDIAGYTGARLVMNVHGSWPNHGLALGLDPDASPASSSRPSSRATGATPGTWTG